MTSPIWYHPGLRVQLLLRTMLGTRWDAETWPWVRSTIREALAMRSAVQRAGWFN
jgi:hypothetical protein